MRLWWRVCLFKNKKIIVITGQIRNAKSRLPYDFFQFNILFNLHSLLFECTYMHLTKYTSWYSRLRKGKDLEFLRNWNWNYHWNPLSLMGQLFCKWAYFSVSRDHETSKEPETLVCWINKHTRLRSEKIVSFAMWSNRENTKNSR